MSTSTVPHLLVPAPGSARGLVVLHPGIFATKDFFLVPGAGHRTIVDDLRDAGLDVALVEPLGIGIHKVDPRTGGPLPASAITLESRTHALLTLLDDLTTRCERLFLLGHSFGGTTNYAAVAIAHREERPWVEKLAGLVAVGSPLRVVRERPRPWSRLFSPGTIALTQQLAPDGWLDAVAFTVAQVRIAARWRDALFRNRWTVGAAMRCASGPCPWLARTPLLPTFLYRAGDYTSAQIRWLLAREAIERESAQLVAALVRAGLADGEIPFTHDGSPLDLRDEIAAWQPPLLTICSATDELVLPEEAEAVGEGWATRLRLAPGCGHGGYFTRAGVVADVRRAIREFVAAGLDRGAPRARSVG